MKCFKWTLSSLVMIFWIGSMAVAENIPNFAPGRYLCIDNVPIMGNNVYSSPDVADWNGDGKKDLLVGAFYKGYIWLFPNVGTDEEPIFTEGTLLEADGEKIAVEFG